MNIEATVIEKTLSNNVIVFRYKPRKDNRRMDCEFSRKKKIKFDPNFLCLVYKGVQTLLRINSIDIIGQIPGTN